MTPSFKSIDTDTERAPDADPTRSHEFASDGWPFAPGTPGTPRRSPELSYVTAISLELPFIDTPERRELVAEEVRKSGIIGTGASRTDAAKFVDLAWQHARGIPIVPAMATWFDKRKKLLDAWNDLQTEQAAAQAAQDRLDAKRARVEKLITKIAQRTAQAEAAEQIIASANPCFNGRPEGPGLDSDDFRDVLTTGSAIAGAREVVVYYRNTLIPALLSEKAKAEADVADLEKRMA